MKKSFFAALAAMTVFTAAAADWRVMGRLQLAPQEDLRAAVMKLSSMSGNAMLGMMLSPNIKTPMEDELGPARAGVPVTYVGLMKAAAEPAAICEDPEENLEYAVVYPVTWKPADFLARYPTCVETNGMLRYVKPSRRFDDDVDDSADRDADDFVYVRFSEDGRYVAYSDRADQLAAALSVLPAVKAMDGDIARLAVNEYALATLAKASGYCAGQATNEVERQNLQMLSETLSGCGSIAARVRVTDAGVDFDLKGKVKAGSELAQAGLKALDREALKFADGEDVFGATVRAADCGNLNRPGQVARAWMTALANANVPVTNFLALAESGAVAKLTLDLAAAVKAATADSEPEVDEDALQAEMMKAQALLTAPHFSAKSESDALALALKGARFAVTPSARFKATLPEVAAKPLCVASVFSLSGLLAVGYPQLLSALPEEQVAAIRPYGAMLPAEASAGVATAVWREGDSLRVLSRISAAEVKSIGTFAGGIMAMAMQSAFRGGNDD